MNERLEQETGAPAAEWQTVVRHSECDRRGRLKLRSWFDFLQEAAAVHAEQLGVGVSMLLEHRMAWVLSRLKLVMEADLRIGDSVAVRTWPNGFHRLFAKRQYELFRAGRRVGYASSFWLLLEAASLRPLKPSALPRPFPDNSARPEFFPELDKLPAPELEAGRLECPVRESLMDVNGHLNNAEYAGFVQDFLAVVSPEWRTRQIQINYLNAIRAPDWLALHGGAANGVYRLAGDNPAGQLCFQAEITG